MHPVNIISSLVGVSVSSCYRWYVVAVFISVYLCGASCKLCGHDVSGRIGYPHPRIFDAPLLIQRRWQDGDWLPNGLHYQGASNRGANCRINPPTRWVGWHSRGNFYRHSINFGSLPRSWCIWLTLPINSFASHVGIIHAVTLMPFPSMMYLCLVSSD